jgi:hypothetical protein
MRGAFGNDSQQCRADPRHAPPRRHGAALELRRAGHQAGGPRPFCSHRRSQRPLRPDAPSPPARRCRPAPHARTAGRGRELRLHAAQQRGRDKDDHLGQRHPAGLYRAGLRCAPCPATARRAYSPARLALRRGRAVRHVPLLHGQALTDRIVGQCRSRWHGDELRGLHPVHAPPEGCLPH